MDTVLVNNDFTKSWERSKKHGANLAKAQEAMLQEYELKLQQEKKRDLLNSMHPTIESLAYSLKSSNTIVVISNSSGYVLNSVGNLTFLDDAEKNNLQNGACWSEQMRGTNSAGTISIEQKPLAVIGNEHYLPSHRTLFCAGSPIFNPSGELDAVLNISGHFSVYHPAMLGMVDNIARNIENWMLVRQPKPQLVISLYPESQKNYEALFAVDLHGQVIGMNREAHRLCRMDNFLVTPIYLEELFSNTDELLSGTRKTNSSLIRLYTKDTEEKCFFASIVHDSRPVKFYTEIKTATKQLKTDKKSKSSYSFNDIYGVDKTLMSALSTAKKAATTDYTIVITGESGTGKEMVSQAIHQASTRSTKPFVALNCGGITKSLAESELFGYEAGAYTGAKQSGQPGVFEQAHGGTLFLDEIAELPMDIQITLLRVLQDFKVKRIGGVKSVQVDVRLITATHTDLWEKVQEGSFRADLYYRLQGISIVLPPLRKREDRLQFAYNLLSNIEGEIHRHSLTFSPVAEQFIKEYSWPGNVRQMSSAIREAAFLSVGDTIDLQSFPNYILSDFQKRETTGS
ncbi:sigma-54-dependent Fis family transcriptional regulator [Sporosarcina ureilytica]|uniref:sigma-54-dependent Fis family transcriptional regulator n=1 Tax=Sporosarcina ureilytica TaxID=298596 RepID=UPI000A74C24B|nr:sigma-54-dependent Fis family transcriptional regulator [Sporosarcina ureilytica]